MVRGLLYSGHRIPILVFVAQSENASMIISLGRGQEVSSTPQRSKLTFSKSRLLATFNCKMVAIKKHSVAKNQKTRRGGHLMTYYTKKREKGGHFITYYTKG